MKRFVLIDSKEADALSAVEGFELNSYPVNEGDIFNIYGEGSYMVNDAWYDFAIEKTKTFRSDYIKKVIDEVKFADEGYETVKFENPVRLEGNSLFMDNDRYAQSFYLDEHKGLVMIKCSDGSEHSLEWFFIDDQYKIAKAIEYEYYGE